MFVFSISESQSILLCRRVCVCVWQMVRATHTQIHIQLTVPKGRIIASPVVVVLPFRGIHSL